jgi:hypothetical protein
VLSPQGFNPKAINSQMNKSSTSKYPWLGANVPSSRKWSYATAALTTLLEEGGCVTKPFYVGNFWPGIPVEVKTWLEEYDKMLILPSQFDWSYCVEPVPVAQQSGGVEFGVSEEFLLDMQSGRYGWEWYSAFVAAKFTGTNFELLGWGTPQQAYSWPRHLQKVSNDLVVKRDGLETVACAHLPYDQLEPIHTLLVQFCGFDPERSQNSGMLNSEGKKLRS